MFHNRPATIIDPIPEQADAKPVPVSLGEPCRIFETIYGDRYLIAEHEGSEVAIVLQHRREGPFIWQRLDRQLCALGSWHGEAKVLPISATNLISGHLPVGAISANAEKTLLLCRTSCGDCDWISLGALIGDPHQSFDHWQIVNGGTVFFEKLPGEASKRYAELMGFAASGR